MMQNARLQKICANAVYSGDMLASLHEKEPDGSRMHDLAQLQRIRAKCCVLGRHVGITA